jgi:hypothetical protein
MVAYRTRFRFRSVYNLNTRSRDTVWDRTEDYSTVTLLAGLLGWVYVAASADGYVVGEELEGDYF